GLRPSPGLAALRALIGGVGFGAADRRQVVGIVDRLEAATSDLAAGIANGAAPQALLDATIAAAERLAALDRLWLGEAGEALADVLARLRIAWQSRPAIAGNDWPALFDAMLAPEMVRPRFGRHPRLAIWGPLEARLQRA